MQHDRSYYRALGTKALINEAREEGINPEMAIAIAERLARDFDRWTDRWTDQTGKFHFNERTTNTHA